MINGGDLIPVNGRVVQLRHRRTGALYAAWYDIGSKTFVLVADGRARFVHPHPSYFRSEPLDFELTGCKAT